MKVTYLHHSGFAVETETKVLLFDYYTQGGRFCYFDPAEYAGKDILVFVSHFHEDHFDRRILDWAGQSGVRYIFSRDVRPGADFKGEKLVVEPHAAYDFAGVHIETLRSNDEGVAFFVEVDGRHIYHAGDLNWWHWNGESDAFNRDIARSYTEEVDKLKGRRRIRIEPCHYLPVRVAFQQRRSILQPYQPQTKRGCFIDRARLIDIFSCHSVTPFRR